MSETTSPAMSDAALRRHIGGEVRAAMARKRVGQRNLAVDLGISVGSLNARLTGKVQFSIGELYRIAELLGVDPLDLFPRPEALAAN